MYNANGDVNAQPLLSEEVSPSDVLLLLRTDVRFQTVFSLFYQLALIIMGIDNSWKKKNVDTSNAIVVACILTPSLYMLVPMCEYYCSNRKSEVSRCYFESICMVPFICLCVYIDFILRDDMTNYRASDYYHLGAVSIATCGVSLDLTAHLLKLCVNTYDDILYCFKSSFASWILLWFSILTGELPVTAEAQVCLVMAATAIIIGKYKVYYDFRLLQQIANHGQYGTSGEASAPPGSLFNQQVATSNGESRVIDTQQGEVLPADVEVHQGNQNTPLAAPM